jgi:hypothetical protein
MQLSVKLTHVELVSVGALDDHVLVENVFEFDLAQPAEIAFQSCIKDGIQRKEDLSPGILSGSERTWRSCLSIIGSAEP